MASQFTADRRERFLTLYEAGRTIEDSCADVGVSTTTISKWAAKGRKPDAREDHAEFAQRFDAIKAGAAGDGLTEDDLVRLLERSARNGSVQAIRLLLERLDKKGNGADAENPDSSDPADAFDRLDRSGVIPLAPRREARNRS